jgi:hypothetical protein
MTTRSRKTVLPGHHQRQATRQDGAALAPATVAASVDSTGEAAASRLSTSLK